MIIFWIILVLGAIWLFTIGASPQKVSLEDERFPQPDPVDEEKKPEKIFDSNALINFFGKVVDVNDQPIPEVKVLIGRKFIHGVCQEQIMHYELITDQYGAFKLTDVRGLSLSIDFQKEGYALFKTTQLNFGYRGYDEIFVPNPEQPVVFKLWKLVGAEAMVHYEIPRIGIPCDGTVVRIELLKGKMTLHGDLEITLKRTPLHLSRPEQKYDWTLIMQIPKGGLIELDDPLLYEAPEHGYLAAVTVQMLASNPKWISKVEKNLCVRFGEDKYYGRIAFELTTDYEPPPAGLKFECWINPSGSKNLEYDPLKKIVVV